MGLASTMAEAQHEAFDEKAWSETMEPAEHVNTYSHFIERSKVVIVAAVAAIFQLMIFSFSEGLFFAITAVILFLFTLVAAVAGASQWKPVTFIAIVSFLIWLLVVL